MIINSINLTNFRSYVAAEFTLNPNITLIVGPNASGKTNILESLYVLALTKSFRARDRDLVYHGQEYFRIVTLSSEGQMSLAYGLENGALSKKVLHDGVKRSLITHIGKLTVSLFEPGDLDLLTGNPEGRRRYLDAILSQTNSDYFSTASDYRRVLKQRNSLLSCGDIGLIKQQIFAWDIKLADLAAQIFGHRQALLDYINNRIRQYYAQIAGEELEFTLTYEPSALASDYGSNFLALLGTNLIRDMAIGFTGIGPHREDFKVSFKNTNITSSASRGEVRTAVLALKLAEIEYIEEVTTKKPLLLLDDVFSELDSSRRAYLLKRLEGYQTIITTTDADHIVAEIPAAHSVIEMVGQHVK